ncbi:hypothetical protein N7508_007597 [Penicillium antarcticum]|uniref:uncharacterized protein n=1 Tax=Penicillium antarcticum TaxID=416450 RepID=UPI002382FAB8|nr:uncharacterized protein N7508_007597 [Penicillium antarcticum]KAJ5297348.1 hypothetical protein N7508_007597 [Penicillium antarcticum]
MANGDMDGVDWPQNFLSSDQANAYQSANQNQGVYDAYQHPAFDDAAQATYMYHQSHSRNPVSYLKASNPAVPSRPSARPTPPSQPINSNNIKWRSYQHMIGQQNQRTVPLQSSDPDSRQPNPSNQTWSALAGQPSQQQYRPTATQGSGYERPQATPNNQNGPIFNQHPDQQQRSTATQQSSQNACQQPISNNQSRSVYNQQNSHVYSQPSNNQNWPHDDQNRPQPQSAISDLSLSHQATNFIDLTRSSIPGNAPSSVAKLAPMVSQPSTTSNKHAFYPLPAPGYHQQTRGPQTSTQDDIQGQPPAKIRRLDNGTAHVESDQPAPVKFNQPPTPSYPPTNPPSYAPSNSPAPIQNKPVNPSIETAPNVRPAYKPNRKAIKNRDDLVRPIRMSDALVKVSYDPATIARDILIAAGKHPKMKGLNHHLHTLRANIPQVDLNSDLATFRWDLVDVEQKPSALPPAKPAVVNARPAPAASVPSQYHVSPSVPITSASTTPAGSIPQWQHMYTYGPPNIQGPIQSQGPVSLALSGHPRHSGPPPSFATPSSYDPPSGFIPTRHVPPPRLFNQRSVPSAISALPGGSVPGKAIPPPGAIPPVRTISPLEPTQRDVPLTSSVLPSSSVPPQGSAPPSIPTPTQKAVEGPSAPRDPNPSHDQNSSPHVPRITAYSPHDTPSTRSARIDARAPPGGLSSWGTLPFQPPTYHSPKRATDPSKFPSGLPRLDPAPEPFVLSDPHPTVSHSPHTETTNPPTPTGQTPKATPKLGKGPRTTKPNKAKPTNPVAPNQPAPVEVAIVTPKATTSKTSSKATPTSVTTSSQKTNPKLSCPQVVIPPSPDKMQPKRKPGRPPRAKGGSAMIEVAIPLTQPVNYPIFHCQWEDCVAELHNLDVLRSHVSKVHIPYHLQCKWKDCEDKEFRAAQRLFEHMAETHFAKMAWELGDGPTVPKTGDSAQASINVTDPSARKGTMALPVDEHQVKAFSKAHGTSTEKLKARDLFQAGQQWKKRTGPALGPSDSPSSTPDRQVNLDCDEVCYISSD